MSLIVYSQDFFYRNLLQISNLNGRIMVYNFINKVFVKNEINWSTEIYHEIVENIIKIFKDTDFDEIIWWILKLKWNLRIK